MSGRYVIHKRDKPTKKVLSTRLLDAGTRFAVGDWIKFEQIGRITELTAYKNSPHVSVKVNIVEDYYNAQLPEPQMVNYFECAECGMEFEKGWQFDLHHTAAHTPKPKAKRKPRKKASEKSK